MKAPKQCRYDMAVRGVIVVARSIHIGRHGRQETRAILAVVAPAALDSGDLCERIGAIGALQRPGEEIFRSEENTSELQSLMRNSYAVLCLKKKKKKK